MGGKLKWTKEAVIEESRKYTTWRDFMQNRGKAYQHSLAYADEITWLKYLAKPKGYWSRDRIFAIARKYSTRVDFRVKSPTAYHHAIQKGYLEEMDWLGFLPTESAYWTFDKAQEESRKYTGKGRKAFQNGSKRAYFVSKHNGWLDKFPWLAKPNPYTTAMHTVYKYEFPEQHAVYIGLTMNTTERDHDHRHEKHGKKSAVLRFADECGVSVPQMVVIADRLTIKDAQRTEGQFVDSFAAAGWKVLNTKPTGEGCSSIGGVAAKWTRHAVFEEARKYRYRGDFYKFSPSAYEKARSTGWIDEMDWWQERPRKPIKEKPPKPPKPAKRILTEIEVRIIGSHYFSRREFAKSERAAHRRAIELGIIDKMFPRLRASYRILATAKDGTIREFSNAYEAARTIGGCRGVIRKASLGKIKTAYGYTWQKIGA